MARNATLTPLGIAVIGLLFERPMHPYEMYQLLVGRHEDRLVKVRPGSLYHTVDKLAEQKLVHAAGTNREGNRPERTVYELTDAGREAFRDRIAEILQKPVREFPIYPIAIGEAHNLEVDEVVGLLRQRVVALENELTDLDVLRGIVEEHRVPEVYWLPIGYLRAMVHTEIDWTTALIERMAGGELDWYPHGSNRLSAESLLATLSAAPGGQLDR